jgi:hypothetical protein
MLWRKAWLECRSRFQLCFTMSFSLALASALPADPEATRRFLGLLGSITAFIGPVGALMLAGSGINTQTTWGKTHGFHPSMYFLLSMPVTRERLLRVRAAMGLALTLLWLTLTVLGLTAVEAASGRKADWAGVLLSLPNLFTGTVIFYMFAVWLTSFLDEFWAGTLSLTITGMLAGYGMAGGPSWFNLATFMSASSLMNLDSLAWLQALTYFAASGVFYWLAYRTVANKEY